MLQSQIWWQIWNPYTIYFRIHVLSCSVNYLFCAMGIFNNVVYWQISVFVEFERAIILEKGQSKTIVFHLFGSQGSHICTHYT